MGGESAASDLAASGDAEATAKVRRRRVYYISGYDPQGPRRYYQLYRTESVKQAEISGYEIDVSPLEYEKGAVAARWSAKKCSSWPTAPSIPVTGASKPNWWMRWA
ncbi:MAG: hypothetical protein AAFU55_09840, partial [Pseudomonadota bacterium]